MTPHYLLDTNILAEPLRPKPNDQIIDHLRRFQNEIAITSVVWHEMWFGCNRLPRSAKRDTIEDYLTRVVATNVPILSYDQQAATWHAAERARLTAIGQTPSFSDGMIAAVAKTNNLILVTFNLDDFQRFQDLQVTDWQQ